MPFYRYFSHLSVRILGKLFFVLQFFGGFEEEEKNPQNMCKLRPQIQFFSPQPF